MLAGFCIQIWKLCIFRGTIFGADLLVALPDRMPPLVMFIFGKANLQNSFANSIVVPFNSPKRIIDFDLVIFATSPSRINDWFCLSFDLHLEFRHSHIYFQILRCAAVWQIVVYCDLGECLFPIVVFMISTVPLIWLQLSIFCVFFLFFFLFFLCLFPWVFVNQAIHFLFLLFLFFDLFSLFLSHLFDLGTWTWSLFLLHLLLSFLCCECLRVRNQR